MMFEILYNSYEFASQLIPFLMVMVLLKKRRVTSYPKRYYLFTAALALYTVCVFRVTGAGTIYEALDWRFRGLADRINLIPFSREIDVRGYVLNVIMFMPFGVLVPLIWKKLANLKSIFLAGLGFSLLIELSQTLSIRGTDVDDLIMNSLGAAIGFLCYKAWDKITRGRLQLDANPRELPVYILTIYLGRCLLYNALGFIHLWYGE